MAREMKNSGIEWIGEIPVGWEMIKFKYIFDIIGGNGFPDILQGTNNGDFPFCKVSDINGDNIYINKANNYVSFATVNKYKFNIIPKHSIILAKIGAALQKNHRKINIVECCIDNNTQALALKRNDDIKYLYYLSKYIDMGWFDNKGTIPSINNSKLLNFFVPDVYYEEQQKIASFLDQKCTEIDAVIEKTKATIEEYKKLKQSVITEAVTKGIRGNRPMKDSGIEWIGEIPVGWDVKVAFQLFKQVKNKNTRLVEKNLLSLSYGKIKRKNIDTVGGLLPESFDGYNIIEANDIVLRLTDLQNDHTSLRVGLATERGIVTSAYITLRNQSRNVPLYLYYYLHTFDICKGFYGMGAGVRQGLNWDGLKLLKIVLPSIEEQLEITHFLERKCAEIDTLIAKKTTLLSELETYKKSLIYEYVTGKKEVK
ncbi:MAG: restriction endonuclease subunit S [Acutalibacteraceae bacterium]|nr:restriction endonuclease subunit S [Acutalibacteraceae bacterium]